MNKGTLCWIYQNNRYQKAIIQDKINNYFIVNGQKYQQQNVYQRKQPYTQYQDMIKMDLLNQPQIFQNLKKRFQNDLIYTYIGPTLISINPFKNIDKQYYQNSHLQKYLKQLKMNQYIQYPLDKLEPHIYGIAASAYFQLFKTKKNQSIVISGQSGSGKTQNTKHALFFLTKTSHSKSNIQKKILSCNPILQTFGNAKTLRNSNSSRFGKYTKVMFNQKLQIMGAYIQNYLLQKSRVNQIAQGQRNYHIFYAFLASPQVKKYTLSNQPQSYKYLNSSSCFQLQQMKNIQQYNQVMQAFKNLNFKIQQVTLIHKLIAAILNIGNIEFDDSKYDQNTPCFITSKNHFQKVFQLLQINSYNLEKALINKIRKIGNQQIISPINLIGCIFNCNSLSRSLYNNLFNWLVFKLNNSIKSQNKNMNINISLLDIFGFECFKNNSLQQLCINFTNQKLQQVYINYLFKSTQKQLLQNGFTQTQFEITYKDNKDILDLIQGKMGIFNILNDSCSILNDTHESFLANLKKQYKNSKNITFPFQNRNTFILIHTPKQVQYTVQSFRSKNIDEISPFLSSIFQQVNPILKEIWNYQKSKDKFLLIKFKKQIKILMQQLQSCNVHFVRCIKPNQQKKPQKFDQCFIDLQIKYLGIFETIKVRKQGYPNRFQYNQFFQTYKYLDKQLQFLIQPKNIKQLLKKILPKNSLLGKKKIFLKHKDSFQLDSQLQKVKLKNKIYINKIIKAFKGWKFNKIVNQRLLKIKNIIKSFSIKQQKIKKYAKSKSFYNIVKYDEFVKNIKEKEKQIQQNQKRQKQRLQKQLQLQNQNQEKKKKQQQKIKIKRQKQKQNQNQQLKHKLKNNQKIQQQIQIKNHSLQQKSELNINTQQTNKFYKQKKTNQQKLFKKYFSQKNNISIQPFKNKGLYIWSYNQIKTQIQLAKERIQNGIYQNFIQQNVKNIEPKLPLCQQTISMKYHNLDQYREQLLQRIRSSSFQKYCKDVLNFQNFKFKKQMNTEQIIQNVMSFQNENLNCSLLNLNGQFQIQINFSFRCLLKLSGDRKSRYSEQENIINILYLCNGLFKNPQTGKTNNILVNNYVYLKKRQTQNSISKNPQKVNYLSEYSSIGFYNQQKDQANFINIGNNENQSDIYFLDINQTIQSRFRKIVSNPINKLRDQIYMHIIKQLKKNPKKKSYDKILQIFLIIVYYFPPSMKLIYPLCNIVLTFLQNNQNINLSKIFYKLTQYVQSYQILSLDHPLKYFKKQNQNKNDLLSSCYILKQQIIQKDITIINDFIQRLQCRKLYLFGQIKKIALGQNLYININLFNGNFIKIQLDPLWTIRKTKNQICKKIQIINQNYYCLFQVINYNNNVNEKILQNNLKIFDVISLQQKKKIKEFNKFKIEQNFYLYLGIKFFYYFTKNNIDQIKLTYSQMNYQVQREKFNLNNQSMEKLEALKFYHQNGPYTSQSQLILQKQIKNQKYQNQNNQILQINLFNNVLQKYKKYQFKSLNQVEWEYLQVLRPYNMFLSHQFNALQWQNLNNFISQIYKTKIFIIIRPMHIILTNEYKEQFLILDYKDLQQYGVGSGKQSTLMIKPFNQDRMLLQVKENKIIEQLISGYNNLRVGKQIQQQQQFNLYTDILQISN